MIKSYAQEKMAMRQPPHNEGRRGYGFPKPETMRLVDQNGISLHIYPDRSIKAQHQKWDLSRWVGSRADGTENVDSWASLTAAYVECRDNLGHQCQELDDRPYLEISSNRFAGTRFVKLTQSLADVVKALQRLIRGTEY